jgi:hypothetical protein
MAWTTNSVTQNGNTTGTWVVTGSALTTHDAIVVRPISGTSGLRLESATILPSPIRYELRVKVVGAGAVAFRFSAEAMD